MVTAFEWWRWVPEHYETPEPDPDPDPDPDPPTSWTDLGAPTFLNPAGNGQFYYTGAVTVGTKIYCLGGVVESAYSFGIRIYDPASNTWTLASSNIAVSRGRWNSIGAIGGRIYGAAASSSGADEVNHTWFEPATDTMGFGNITGAAGRGAGAQTALGGRLYVAGGSDFGPTATVRAYNPATDTWANRAALPSPRMEHCTRAANGKLYVFGGRTASGGAVTTDVLAYDPATNTWATRAPMPVALTDVAAANDGRYVWIIGGQSAGVFQTTIHRYDTETDTWETPDPPLPVGRSGAAAEIVAGDLYVIGGRYSGGTVKPPTLKLAGITGPVDEEPPPDPEPVLVPGAWALDEDRSAALMSWSITYGRQDSTEKAAPTTATVGLGAARAGACPVAGERFRLAVDGDPRFTGETTDPKIDPPARTYAVTGAGRLGRARRRPIKGGRTYPLALDGARVARILDDAADGDLEVSVDTGTALILPPTRNVAAGQLLDLTSDSTGGQVVEQLDGSVEWHDADHRRDAPIALTLDAGEILNDLTFEQHVGDLVNEAEISYGYDAVTVRVTDPVSIDDREVYPASVSTALVDASDAYDLGTYLVGRRSEPVWQLPNLLVDLGRGVDPAKRAALLALRFGDRIAVTGLPALAPYAADVELYVEGITEAARVPRPGQVDWRLAIAVSDPALSGVSIRWKDAPAALTWDGVDPVLTWLDLARMENPTDLEA